MTASHRVYTLICNVLRVAIARGLCGRVTLRTYATKTAGACLLNGKARVASRIDFADRRLPKVESNLLRLIAEVSCIESKELHKKRARTGKTCTTRSLRVRTAAWTISMAIALGDEDIVAMIRLTSDTRSSFDCRQYGSQRRKAVSLEV